MAIQHLKQTGEVKKLNKWVPQEMILKKKIIVLKCHLLLFFTITTTVSCLDCDMERKMDFIWQLEMTSSVAGPRSSSKPLPKAKLPPKKWSWSLFGGLLPVWSTTVSCILAKLLHLRSMLSKSMRYTKKCKAYSQYWSHNGPSSPQQHLITHHTTNTSEAEWIGLQSCTSYAIFAWPLANWLPLLQAFQQLCRENTSTTNRM